MPVMNRLLTSLLLVSLLTAAMAWASDVHVPVGMDESSQVVALDYGHADGDALAPCHYCGCGAAHVLALPSTTTLASAGNGASQHASYRYSIVSHLSDPIGKPPRA